MNPTSPLEQALAAWGRVKDADNRQPQFDDAVALGETGMFSNRNISHITGLSQATVAQLTRKTDITGGRLAPESLDHIYEVWLMWARDRVVDGANARRAYNLGSSWRVIAGLTGIPLTTLCRNAKETP